MKLGARSLNETLDHQNIWLWIQACNIRHAERCIATPVASRQPSQVPDWVIDTTAACLVPGSSAGKYVALSYVWPTPSPAASPAGALLLERATLPYFRTPGFFLDDGNMARIPQVIQDAVRLTQGFGERFIWVDRLCIIQNDDATYTQVQRMHEIYWGAYVTIVAAASGSLYGSTSSEDHQQKSDFPKKHARATNDDPGSWSAYHLALMHEHYARLSRSKWGGRGWTYQEKILSRRTIILLDDDMFWDCQCALWDCNGLDPFTENTWTSRDGEHGHHRLDMRLTPSTTVDFSLYVELICPYNARDLLYAQDVIPAFTGILNTLAPAFPGGFAAALPLAHLDSMLLWQPRKGALRREGTTHPSWSWTGWRCEIDPWSLRSGLARAAIHQPSQPSTLQQRAGSWTILEDVEYFVASPEASWHLAAGQVRAGQVEVQQGEQEEETRTAWFRPDTSSGEGEGAGTSPRDPICLGSVPRDIPPVDTLLFFQTSSAFFRVAATEKAFQEPPEAETRFRELVGQRPKPAALTLPFGAPGMGQTGGLFGDSRSSSAFGETHFGGVSFGSTSKVSVYESSFSTPLDTIDQGTSLILNNARGRFAGVIRMLDAGECLGSTVELVALSQGSVRYRDLDAEYEERWRQEISPWPIIERNDPPYPRLSSLLSSAVLIAPSISTVDAGGTWNLHPPATLELPGPPYQTDTLTCGAPLSSEDDGIFEFYNVLLVERKGHVASRRGCGRVPKRVWDESASPLQQFILA